MGVRGNQVDAAELFALGDCDDGLNRIALASWLHDDRNQEKGTEKARTAAMVDGFIERGQGGADGS